MIEKSLNNNLLSETAESRLSRLIDSGDSVNSALLKRALADKEITILTLIPFKLFFFVLNYRYGS